jgi:TonB family protein
MSQTTEALTIALVRCAARTAPSSLTARLEEEWLADMQERSSSLSRLRFAVGCYWASIAIGLQHRPIRVPAASSAHGNASMLLEPPGFLSSRAATFSLVLSLHAAVLCGLMMAGTKLLKPAEPPAIQPRVIDRPLPQIKPPPPDINRSLLENLRFRPLLLPEVRPAEVANIVSDPDPVAPQPLLSTVNSPPRETVRVQGGTGPAFPHPADYYPDASRRLQEQGATILRVCVDAAGRLSEDPAKQATSGSPRLDAAAIKLARAGSGNYRPATEDGRPVASCYPIKIRFQLRN